MKIVKHLLKALPPLRKLLDRMESRRTNKRLKRLRNPAALEKKLAEIDQMAKVNRIFIMGCGRSGTWLVTSLLSTFKDLDLVAKELPVEFFGVAKGASTNLVVKRAFNSYESVETIPASINILWIVRHPFDVLTSHNPTNPRHKYHIQPHRFLGEMLALQYLVESGRKNTLVVKYEDLVEDPERIQNQIAQAFGLEIKAKPHEWTNLFKASEGVVKAMHGLRPIDAASVQKYVNDPQKIQHLREIYPRISPCLDWLAREFDYDVRLP